MRFSFFIFFIFFIFIEISKQHFQMQTSCGPTFGGMFTRCYCKSMGSFLENFKGTLYFIHMQSSFGPTFWGMFARCYYKVRPIQTLTNFIKQITEPKGEKKKEQRKKEDFSISLKSKNPKWVIVNSFIGIYFYF